MLRTLPSRFSFNALSVFNEEPHINTKDVVGKFLQLDLLTVDADDLEQEFDGKDWIYQGAFLFTELMNFQSSIPLKEYFS